MLPFSFHLGLSVGHTGAILVIFQPLGFNLSLGKHIINVQDIRRVIIVLLRRCCRIVQRVEGIERAIGPMFNALQIRISGQIGPFRVGLRRCRSVVVHLQIVVLPQSLTLIFRINVIHRDIRHLVNIGRRRIIGMSGVKRIEEQCY